jgi:uncharacterized protein (TIGR03435 family)
VIRRIFSAALLSCGLALGQSVATPSTAPTPSKPLAFEVVSIHPSKPGTNMVFSVMTTPDGYRVTGQPLFYTIMVAYFPQGMAYWSADRLSGVPAWLNDQYDINAKVSDADLAEWQKQGLLGLDKKVMLQQMLQAMLADRCHLVAHMVPGPPIDGWSLEPGKRSLRLTDSNPDETLPPGMRLLGGGVMVGYGRGEKPIQTFYRATMADFSQYLSMRAVGHPVLDHTGPPVTTTSCSTGSRAPTRSFPRA